MRMKDVFLVFLSLAWCMPSTSAGGASDETTFMSSVKVVSRRKHSRTRGHAVNQHRQTRHKDKYGGKMDRSQKDDSSKKRNTSSSSDDNSHEAPSESPNHSVKASTPSPTGSHVSSKSKGKGRNNGGENSKGGTTYSSSSRKGKSSKREKKKKPKTSKSKIKKKSSKKSSKETSSPAETHVPTMAPELTPSVDPPSSTRPPNPPTEPTSPPVDPPVSQPIEGPTPRPVQPPSSGSIVRQLPQYGLAYTVTENRIPFRSEYLEVVDLTRVYLAGFFFEEYGDAQTTDLEEFLTIFVDSTFTFGEPIPIDYDSSAVFAASSIVVPTVQMLDRTLETAFEGENLNGFIGMLQSLPSQNVFSTTIFVNQTEPGSGYAAVQSSSTGSQSLQKQDTTTATGAIVGAAAFVLLAAGYMFMRRRKTKIGTMDEGACFINPISTKTHTYSDVVPPEYPHIAHIAFIKQPQSCATQDAPQKDDATKIAGTDAASTDFEMIAKEWRGSMCSISLS